MSVSRKVLCLVYGLIAVLALMGTWGNNVAYLHLGFLDVALTFLQDTLANPASRSITVDLFFLSLAVVVWMVLEARRLGMRGVWLYSLFGILIAISVTVPIFLINRERVLATREPSSSAGTMRTADLVGLIAIGVAVIAYAATTLFGSKS